MTAMQRIVGSFVSTGNPFGLLDITSMQRDASTVFASPRYPMLNLNQTGGVHVPAISTLDTGSNKLGAKWPVGPGLKNKFEVVNFQAW